MSYLLDTNSLSYAFRGEGGVAQRILALSPGDLGLPAPVLYESRAGILRLAAGTRRDALLAALDRLVASIAIAPLDAKAAQAAARIRVDLADKGTPIGSIDTLIAGIAVSTGAVLVTRNTREFARIERLEIEDWY